MDLITQLRSFVAVAQAGSFTAAAAELQVPQPVVSRRILALEKRLGAGLFHRGRRTELTDDGRHLLPAAIDLVSRADRLLNLATEHRERKVRVGVPIDADPRFLAIAAAAATSLGVTLEVVTGTLTSRARLFANGELQVAVVDALPDTADAAVPLGIGARRSSGVSREGRPFHLDQLRRSRAGAREPLQKVLLSAEDHTATVRRSLENRMARSGLSPGQVEVADSVAAAVTRVHSGIGVLVCGRELADKHRLTWHELGGAPLVRWYRFAQNLREWSAGDAQQLIRAIGGSLRSAVGACSPETVGYISPRSLASSSKVER